METLVTKNIHELTLSQFIDCYIDKNYDVLIVSGSGTPEELKERWDYVYADYCELTEDENYKTLVTLAQDIAYNNWKLVGVRASIAVLRYRYHEQSVETLRHFEFMQNINPDNPEQYNKTLDFIEKKLIAVEAAVKSMQAEFNRLTASTEDEKPSRVQFYDIIAHMGKFMGHAIQPEIMLASQFARNLKLMKDAAQRTPNDRET